MVKVGIEQKPGSDKTPELKLKIHKIQVEVGVYQKSEFQIDKS